MKRLDWEELDRLRIEQAKKLAILEEQYWKSKEGTLQGKLMKQRLGFAKKESDAPSPPEKKDEKEDDHAVSDKSKRRRRKRHEGESEDEPERSKSRRSQKQDDEFTFGVSDKSKRRPQTGRPRGNRDPVDIAITNSRRSASNDSEIGDGLKSKKSVKIMEPGFETGPVRRDNDPDKPLKSALSRSRGRSKSSNGEKKWYDPGIKEAEVSPRRKVYEAKYEKFLANKRQKDFVEKRAASLKQPNFDVTTKSRDSPSKRTANYKGVVGADIKFKSSGKFEAEELVPAGYEEHLMRQELLKK